MAKIRPSNSGIGNERRIAWPTQAGERRDTGDRVAKGAHRSYASGAVVHQLSETRASPARSFTIWSSV